MEQRVVGGIPLGGLPFGVLPVGTRVEHKFPKLFDPASEAALKQVREAAGDRYIILIFRAEAPKADGNTTVHMHCCRGNSWNIMWWMLAFQIFLGEMLKFNPANLFRQEAGPAPEFTSKSGMADPADEATAPSPPDTAEAPPADQPAASQPPPPTQFAPEDDL